MKYITQGPDLFVSASLYYTHDQFSNNNFSIASSKAEMSICINILSCKVIGNDGKGNKNIIKKQ
jgi:hypothetical protein